MNIIIYNQIFTLIFKFDKYNGSLIILLIINQPQNQRSSVEQIQMNFTVKPLINNLDDNQLIRVFLEFVYKNNIPYEKNVKQISYKCHQATWIIPSAKAMGYGRTQSEAYQQALRNLFDFLLEAERSCQGHNQETKNNIKGLLSIPKFQIQLSQVIRQSGQSNNIKQRKLNNSNLKNAHSTSKFSSNKAGISVLAKHQSNVGSINKIIKRQNNSSTTSLTKNSKNRIMSNYEKFHIKTQYKQQESYEKNDKSPNKDESHKGESHKNSKSTKNSGFYELVTVQKNIHPMNANLQQKTYSRQHVLNKSKSKKSQVGLHHQNNLSNLSSHTNASNHSSYSNQYTQLHTTKPTNSTNNHNSNHKNNQQHFKQNTLNINNMHNINKSAQNYNKTISNITGKDKQKRDIYYSKIVLNKSVHSETVKSENQANEQKSQSTNIKVKAQLRSAKQILIRLERQLSIIIESNEVLKMSIKQFNDTQTFDKIQVNFQGCQKSNSMNMSFNENSQQEQLCLQTVKNLNKDQSAIYQQKQQQITYHSSDSNTSNHLSSNNNKNTDIKQIKQICPQFSSYKNSNVKEDSPQQKTKKIVDIENININSVSLNNNQKNSQRTQKLRNPMKFSNISVNSKCQIPKLKLDILPNYHKKNQKSLNQTLLANYNQRHGAETEHNQLEKFDKIVI